MERKTFLVTFPQCPTTKAQVHENLQTPHLLNTAQVLSYYEIAQERHLDGNPHLHIYLVFQSPINIRTPTFFNQISFDPLLDKIYQANISPSDSVGGTLDYIRKQDKETLKWGQLSLQMQNQLKSYKTPVRDARLGDHESSERGGKASKVSKAQEVAMALKTGSSLADVDELNPGYFLQNQKNIRLYHSYVQTQQTRKHLKPFTEIIYCGYHKQTQTIVDWLNFNLLQKRQHKQQQLYISGPPNSRKTSLVLWLAEFLSVYEMPTDHYCSGYSDDSFDMIVFDEFVGSVPKGKPQTVINQILEGKPMHLPNRYEMLMKFKNLPCLILSNWTLDEIYNDAKTNAQMKARVLEVKLEEDSPIQLQQMYMDGSMFDQDD